MSEAQALGLELPPTPERAGDAGAYGVWPENLPALELFLRCATQWRSGAPSPLAPAGVYGLDYDVVLKVGRLYLPAETEMRDVLEDVQLMERRALELSYEQAKRGRS